MARIFNMKNTIKITMGVVLIILLSVDDTYM